MVKEYILRKLDDLSDDEEFIQSVQKHLYEKSSSQKPQKTFLTDEEKAVLKEKVLRGIFTLREDQKAIDEINDFAFKFSSKLQSWRRKKERTRRY